MPAASPSAHSISTATPDRTRFPRGSSSRSTFHGEQLRERRNATYNGPPASPSHETSAFAHARRGTSTGIISKITSKFVRRLVPRVSREKRIVEAQPVARALIEFYSLNINLVRAPLGLRVPSRICLVSLLCIYCNHCLTRCPASSS